MYRFQIMFTISYSVRKPKNIWGISFLNPVFGTALHTPSTFIGQRVRDSIAREQINACEQSPHAYNVSPMNANHGQQLTMCLCPP